MGTRNLTMIRLGGELKLANYGQWDGYPTGQGVTVAAFIQAYLLDDTLRGEFAKRVAKLRFGTDAEIEQKYQDWRDVEAKHRKQAKAGEHIAKYELDRFVAFNRDTGAKILSEINDGFDVHMVKDDREFLQDGLFCEWAYCVDLDTCKVDVYNGGKTPAASIPFAKFTVIAMRTLSKRIARNETARKRRADKKMYAGLGAA